MLDGIFTPCKKRILPIRNIPELRVYIWARRYNLLDFLELFGQAVIIGACILLQKPKFFGALPEEFAEFLTKMQTWKYIASLPSAHAGSGRPDHFGHLLL